MSASRRAAEAEGTPRDCYARRRARTRSRPHPPPPHHRVLRLHSNPARSPVSSFFVAIVLSLRPGRHLTPLNTPSRSQGTCAPRRPIWKRRRESSSRMLKCRTSSPLCARRAQCRRVLEDYRYVTFHANHPSHNFTRSEKCHIWLISFFSQCRGRSWRGRSCTCNTHTSACEMQRTSKRRCGERSKSCALAAPSPLTSGKVECASERVRPPWARPGRRASYH